MMKPLLLTLVLMAGMASAQVKIGPSVKIGSAGPFGPALTSVLTNAIFVSGYKNITSTGDTDIYTVPANKRAMVGAVICYNNSGSSNTIYTETKISSTYYRLGPGLTIGNNASGTPAIAGAYVMEAGETFAVHVPTAQPVNCWFPIYEFSNASGFKTVKLTSLSSGDNTLYTVTSGKSAIVTGAYNTVFPGSTVLSYVNGTGGALTIHWNVVPNGSSVGTTNQISAATSVSSLASSSLGLILTLNSGDFISINTSANTAGQIAFVTVLEQ